MSEGKRPPVPAFASDGFSSTPVKGSDRGGVNISGTMISDVLSEDDTYSLLSPIYHDSFDSDDELDAAAQRLHQTDTPSSHSDDPIRRISPVRCELPKSSIGQAVKPATTPELSAWEMWLLNKTKLDLIKLDKKAEEECLLQKKRECQEREQKQKRIAVEERMEEWLKAKKEQEKQEKWLKESKEQVEAQRQKAKQRETEKKAREKYKVWLRNKNQEQGEKEKREKEEAARKEEQEKERRRVAEERFKEWLASANAKARASPLLGRRAPFYPRSPFNKACSSPSFYNPVPWKPVDLPPPETPQKNKSSKKPQSNPKH